MPIDSVHPDYAAYKTEFKDCRNAYEGSRAVKKAGAVYLPPLTGQTSDEYEAYKKRAVFFGVTQKTVSALVGMAMMREPIIKASDEMDPYFKDRQGAQFFEILGSTIGEVSLMGGYGLLIDAPTQGGIPQIFKYTRESVINWRVDPESNRLLMVMLHEFDIGTNPGDEYEYTKVDKWRKLYIGADGLYHVTIYDSDKKFVSDIAPTINRSTIKEIPFFMITPFGVNMEVVSPPMLDIVDLNLSLYRTSADLEHGRHFTGLPTPVVTGVEATELKIGSSTAWVLPNEKASASYLEFTGQGLQSLEKAVEEKQSQMASMSARLIDNSKRGSEAEGTVRLRYMSETASLTSTVRSVEEGLSQVYGRVAEFIQTTAPEIILNKNFIDSKLSASDLTALVKAYTDGTMSKDTFLYNLRKADMISVHQDDDTEKAIMIEEGGVKPPKQVA
jgi:hypothetical protein